MKQHRGEGEQKDQENSFNTQFIAFQLLDKPTRVEARASSPYFASPPDHHHPELLEAFRSMLTLNTQIGWKSRCNACKFGFALQVRLAVSHWSSLAMAPNPGHQSHQSSTVQTGSEPCWEEDVFVFFFFFFVAPSNCIAILMCIHWCYPLDWRALLFVADPPSDRCEPGSQASTHTYYIALNQRTCV